MMKREQLTGRLVDSLGLPVALRITVAAPALCGESAVGDGGSDHDGKFTIALTPANASRLVLQLHHGGQSIAKREIDLRAQRGELEVRLAAGEDPFTEHERAVRAFVHQLGDFDVGKLCPESAAFISAETALPLAWSTALATAIEISGLCGPNALAGKARDPVLQALYALARANPAGTSRQLLSAGPESWRGTIERAASRKQIAPLAAKELCAAIDMLRELAVREHGKPVVTGEAPVMAILETAQLDPKLRDDVIARYVEHRGSIEEMLESLAGEVGGELRATFTGASLVYQHVPLLAELQKERVAAKATDWRHLVRRTPADWQEVVAATGVPESMFGATAEAKQAHYVALIQRGVEKAYPGTALAEALRRSPNGEDERALIALLDSPAGDALIAKRAGTNGAELPSEGKTLARMYGVTDRSDEAVTLYRAGYATATAIKAAGKQRFVAHVAMPAARAAEVFRIAEHRSNVAEAALLRMRDRLATEVPAAIGGQGQGAEYRAMFGNLDHCACDHCSSLLGPAAYLVDIFAFLDGLEGGQPLAELFRRRPDLPEIELDCANSHTLLPYIDLVNEILEHAVAGGPVARQTTWKAPQLAAEPEHLLRAAYDRLIATERLASWRLPFDLWDEEARAYLAAIEVPRHRLLALGGADAARVVAERLGFGMPEAAILTGTSGHRVAAFWGGSLVAGIAEILRIARLTYRELAALGETGFVGPLAIINANTCDTSQMSLPADGREGKLDRIHRFVRLQRRLGWSTTELDHAITLFGGSIDAALLRAIADIRDLAAELGWTHTQALAFFDPSQRSTAAFAAAASIDPAQLDGYVALTGVAASTPTSALELVQRIGRVRASAVPLEVWHYVLDVSPLGDAAAPDDATIARHLGELRRELQPLDAAARTAALGEVLGTALSLRVPVIEALFAAHPALSTPFLAATFIDSPRDEAPTDAGVYAAAFAAFGDLHRAGSAMTALSATVDQVAWMFSVTPPPAAERFAIISPPPPSTELADWGIDEARVRAWSAAPTQAIATAIKTEVRGRFTADEWAVTGKAVRDPIREKQAAALTDFLLASGPPAGTTRARWRDTNDVYAYYLVDPEMSACCSISRIKLAHSSTQLFVQRCLLGLETGIAGAAAAEDDWRQWEWRKNYRVWEAARRVILHPENYILHETLDRKSPLFSRLEKQLGQDEVTDANAEAALRKYLDGLLEIANLEIAATAVERNGIGKEVVHVIGRTSGVPRRHFYRQRITGDHGTWWTPWELVPVDIDHSDSLLIQPWNRKLWLFWTQLVDKQDMATEVTIGEGQRIGPSNERYKAIRLAWCTKTSTGWSDKALGTDEVTGPANAEPRLRATPVDDGLVIDCDPVIEVARDRGQAPTWQFHLASSTGASRVVRDTRDQVYRPAGWTPIHGGFRTEAALVEFPRRRQHLLMDVHPDTPHWEWRLVPPNNVALDGVMEMFASDQARAFFIDWSAPTEILEQLQDAARSGNWLLFGVLALAAIGGARYRAELTSHPFAALFARELERDGLRALYERGLQLDPWRVAGAGPVTFASHYEIGELVEPYPVLDLDFDEASAFAQYHWELFFHAPMLIAERLMQNQRFAEAQQWFHRVFDPTQTTGTVPERYWITRPFFELQRDGDTDRTIEQLGDPGTPHPELYRQVEAWEDDPFSPHRVARMRPVAYMKSVFMKYLDNLIAWGDSLFRQDTIESINEAMQLYVLAAELLGARPQEVTRSSSGAARSYAQIRGDLDALSNAALERVENRLLQRSRSKGGTLAGANTRLKPKLGGMLAHLPLFCFPTNDKLLGYWDVIADRFFKIRHCQNFEGVTRQLALFEPPIDPALLARARELGVDLRDALAGTTASPPHHRFSVLTQHAAQLCQETRNLGSALLSALEKRDGEELARLRASQELHALDIARATREHQVDEATEARDAMLRTRDSTTRRRDYYASRQFMTPAEVAQQALTVQALSLEAAAGGLDLVGNVLSLIPDVKIGAPFSMGATFGGSNIAPAVRAFGAFARSQSSVAGTAAQMVGTLASYQRRMDDWQLQKELADDELQQLEHQIAAAELRLAIARNELAAFDRQRENAAQTERTLRDKYTNEELYAWMVGQVSAVHFQCYQLAYEACLGAQRAFAYETQDTQTFIRPGYWDSLRSGLVAGDKLAFDLRRLEAAYLERNRRDFEITKHVSLAQVDPLALLALRREGSCYVTLTEDLFERDFPGHLMRRIRSVGVSLPSVAGPYVGVNATISLERSTVRMASGAGGLRTIAPPVTSIATSSGRDDAGVFEANARDERFLPFEGAGAISQWRVQLPTERAFDYDTIADVIFHVRYTARPGSLALPTPPAMETAAGRMVMLDIKQQFSTAWHRFLNVPEDGEHVLELALGARHVPFRLRGDFAATRFDLMLTTTSSPTITLALPGGAPVRLERVADSEIAGLAHFRAEVTRTTFDDRDATWRIVATGLGGAAVDDGFVILSYA